jgi:hypothetical protein
MNWYTKKFSFKIDPKKIYIRLLRSEKNINIWLVNGDIIRKSYSVDYTMGGNDRVYKFIPENEIWIDNAMSEKDRSYTIIHELRERRAVSEGATYEEAHKQANILEVLCRNNKIDVEKMINKELEKNLNS